MRNIVKHIINNKYNWKEVIETFKISNNKTCAVRWTQILPYLTHMYKSRYLLEIKIFIPV